jgi:Tol biopolymer transport system component
VPGDKALVAVRQNQGNRSGVFLISLPSGKEDPLITGAKSGRMPRALDVRTSPDGKWVAFEDRNEQQVHVHAIDGTTSLQVSDQGGTTPMWGKDSQQLFYLAPGGMTVVQLQTAPTLSVRSRSRVSTTSSFNTVVDVAADGTTFLVLDPISQGPRVFVVFGWAADVRRQLAK